MNIEDIRQRCLKKVEICKEDLKNPLNHRVSEYLEGKKNAYNTILKWITEAEIFKEKEDFDK